MTAAAIDDIDAWLWGAGYSEQGRAYYPPSPEPIQTRVFCAKCGEPVPTDDHVAYDVLPYHNRCLPPLDEKTKSPSLQELIEESELRERRNQRARLRRRDRQRAEETYRDAHPDEFDEFGCPCLPEEAR